MPWHTRHTQGRRACCNTFYTILFQKLFDFSPGVPKTRWKLRWSRPNYRKVARVLTPGPSSLGVPWHAQYFADQLTLFQPGETNYAHLITTGIPGFSDLPTALNTTKKIVSDWQFVGLSYKHLTLYSKTCPLLPF